MSSRNCHNLRGIMKNCYISYLSTASEMDMVLSLALKKQNIEYNENIDWMTFDRLARGNGLVGLIQSNVDKPYEYYQKIKEQPCITAYRREQQLRLSHTMRQIKVLVEIMSIFETRNIRALSLKGPLLGTELYGDPSLRCSADLDILVEPEGFELAADELSSAGYDLYTPKKTVFDTSEKRSAARGIERDKEEKHEVFLKNDLRIELHREADTHWRMSFEELWEHRYEKKLLGNTVCCMGRYDELAYLICHAAGHGFYRISWLIEIFILLSRADISIDELYRHMKKLGVGMLLFAALALIFQISAIPAKDINAENFTFERSNAHVIISYDSFVKNDVRLGIRLADAAGKRISHQTDNKIPSDKRYTSLLPRYGRAPSRFAYILSVLRPCEADLELIDLPDSLFFLYYIIRPFYKLWRMTPFYHADNRS